MDLHEIAKLVAGRGPTMRLRQAKVTAIAGDGTLSVTVAGSAVVLTGVKKFASVSATVGANVFLLTDGVDLIAIGTIA